MKLKSKAIVISLYLGLTIPSFNAGAAMAVVDMASIGQLVKQLEQMRDQLEQAREHYRSLTGIRGFGDLFNNPLLREYLPEEWTNLYDAVQQGDIAGISGRVDELIAAAKEGSIEEISEDVETRQIRLGAVNRAVGEAGFDAAVQRTEQIQSLIEEISNTQDPKGVAELQARIAGEQAAVANEMAKLQLVAILQQAEERMIDERAKEIFKRHMTGSNAVPPPPSIEELLRMPPGS